MGCVSVRDGTAQFSVGDLPCIAVFGILDRVVAVRMNSVMGTNIYCDAPCF